jgi:hypothetical protein
MKSKKTITFLLFILFTTKILASDTAVDGIYYNFDKSNSTAKVTYKGAEDDWMYDYTGEEQYTGNLVIPSHVTFEGKEYTVVGFDDEALIGSKLLETLTIPATVTSFGNYVFTYCNSLHTIIIDQNNPIFFTYSGVMYRKSPSLELFFVPRAIKGNIEIYNGITTIPSSAFQYTKISGVTIPSSVSLIKDGAFNNCTQLQNVTIGNNVTNIGKESFSQCSSLREIEIPSSVKTIEASAFSSNSYLSKVKLNEGLETIKPYAFSYCYSLSSIYLPSTLNLIEDKAFWECTSLKKITNASDLNIEIGSTTNGYVAYYATEIIEQALSLEETNTDNSTNAFSTREYIVISNAKNQHINIYNVLGECVYSQICTTNSIQIPISKTGIYIVKIGLFSKKLIVKN